MIELDKVVYLEPYGNEARRTSRILEGKVSKIGRKYYTVEVDGYSKDYEFNISDNRPKESEWSNNTGYNIYFSKEYLDEKIERENFSSFLRKVRIDVITKNLTIEKIREIVKIIKEAE